MKTKYRSNTSKITLAAPLLLASCTATTSSQIPHPETDLITFKVNNKSNSAITPLEHTPHRQGSFINIQTKDSQFITKNAPNAYNKQCSLAAEGSSPHFARGNERMGIGFPTIEPQQVQQWHWDLHGYVINDDNNCLISAKLIPDTSTRFEFCWSTPTKPKQCITKTTRDIQAGIVEYTIR